MKTPSFMTTHSIKPIISQLHKRRPLQSSSELNQPVGRQAYE